jgi:hypothetical protein
LHAADGVARLGEGDNAAGGERDGGDGNEGQGVLGYLRKLLAVRRNGRGRYPPRVKPDLLLVRLSDL